jgi:hypothetical protein
MDPPSESNPLIEIIVDEHGRNNHITGKNNDEVSEEKKGKGPEMPTSAEKATP